jgi:hypothetical protein
VLSAYFCYLQLKLTRDARALNAHLSVINAERVGFQALINDCMEYSKKNPAIDPILKSVGLKQQ